MSAAEETLGTDEISKRRSAPILNRFLDFISSVRFGVSLLIALVVLSVIGMLIVQQNVDGFDAYFASLTPAEKLVFGRLGFFDIYHSWYFNALLLILSLNIVLASIDRFPSAWSYIVKPKTWATRKWLHSQQQASTIELEMSDLHSSINRVKSAFEKNGLKTIVSEKHGLHYVFGERGKWNRIGAYIVHIALLTLFLGHFVALQTGFDADVRMIPGQETSEIQMIQFDLDKKEKFNVQLPFTLTCTDIQQKLIDARGSIDVTNTLDWRTQMRVEDPQYGTTVADISMNKPFSYRGYRFFQAQTIPVGNAREITLDLTSQESGEKETVTIPRQGSATLANGTKVEYEEFLPDFFLNGDKPDTRTGEYNNPAAVLNVTPPGGSRIRVFAMGEGVMKGAPMLSAPKAGYKWRLAEYEKSPFAHVLSIKYDPFNGAFIAWYFGGFGLIAALGFVFFFSHKRIWALLQPNANGTTEVTLGGHTNRNHAGFEQRFARVVSDIKKEPVQVSNV
jgi:cytochrome c biogenesis protein